MREQDYRMLAHNAVERVCQLLGDVSTAQVWSLDRHYKVATARQLVMWYLVRVCRLGYSDAGKAMGKHHATIMWGVRQAEVMISSGRAYDRRIRDAARALTDEHEDMQDLRQGAPRHGVHPELLDQCQEQDMPRVRGREAAHENAEEA